MHRVLLIDDHAIVRVGFRLLFEQAGDFRVVAEAANADEALVGMRQHRPDIVIVDISLGDGRSGLTLLPGLLEACPTSRAVVLSMHADPGLVVRALDSGAAGFVTKAAAAEELVALLRQVMAGQRVLSSDLTPPAARRDASTQLSTRERSTLRHMLSDQPPKAVAHVLGISDKTFYRHRANLMEKLGVRSQGELARVVRERGLLLEDV